MNRKLSFYLAVLILFILFPPLHGETSQKINLNEGLDLYLKGLLKHKSLSSFIIALGIGLDMPQNFRVYPIFKNLCLFSLLKFNSIRYYAFKPYLKKRTNFIFGCMINFFAPNLSLLKIQFNYFLRKKKINLDKYLQFYLISIFIFMIKPNVISNSTFTISFLFWGTYFFYRENNFIYNLIGQLIACLIISFFTETYLSITGFLLGQTILYCYRKIYPFILFFFFLTITGFFPTIESVWWKLYQLFKLLAQISLWDRTSSSLLLITCLAMILKTRKMYPILIFFIFQSDWVQAPVIYYLK